MRPRSSGLTIEELERVCARRKTTSRTATTASDEEVDQALHEALCSRRLRGSDQALIMAAGIASRYKTGPRLETFR